MTDRSHPDLPDEDDDDLLAAEYALGVLDGDAWRAARDRAGVDGGFAARVAAWEARLAPMADAVDPQPVPAGQFARIEARLFAPRAAASAPPRRFWRGWLAGALVAAGLGMAALLVLTLLTGRPDAPQAPQVASLDTVLAAEDSDLRLLIRFDPVAGLVSLTREAGSGPEPGQDFELWALDDAGTPRSLGLVSAAVVQRPAVLQPGEVLAVSLEPAGGSPDPVPSGPVLAAAPLGGG